MASTNPIVEKAVQTALKDLQSFAPQDWQKLKANKAEEQVVIQDATKAAEGEVNQQATFSFMLQPGEPKEAELSQRISEKLAQHLPKERIELIAKGLQIPTYRLNFRRESSGNHVDIQKKSGEKFMNSIHLATAENLATADALQYASIVVEAIALLFSIAGIVVPEEVMAKVAQQIATTIMESSAVKAAIEAMKRIWGSGGSGSSKAAALWELIKAVWNYRKEGNIFMQIVKGLCQNLSWFDWMKTAGIVAAMVAAAIATDGIALIAKIVLALNSAYDFGKKLANLNELDEIRKTL